MLRYFLALSFVVVTAHAQTGAATIDPGMTRAQVIERLGKPATVRTYQGSTTAADQEAERRVVSAGNVAGFQSRPSPVG